MIFINIKYFFKNVPKWSIFLDYFSLQYWGFLVLCEFLISRFNRIAPNREHLLFIIAFCEWCCLRFDAHISSMLLIRIYGTSYTCIYSRRSLIIKTSLHPIYPRIRTTTSIYTGQMLSNELTLYILIFTYFNVFYYILSSQSFIVYPFCF